MVRQQQALVEMTHLAGPSHQWPLKPLVQWLLLRCTLQCTLRDLHVHAGLRTTLVACVCFHPSLLHRGAEGLPIPVVLSFVNRTPLLGQGGPVPCGE